MSSAACGNAMADEREPARRGHEPAELVAQRGLADARLADDQDQRAITFCRRSERRLQLAKFSLAADEGLTLGDMVLGQLP
jgi:hypothetical protein